MSVNEYVTAERALRYLALADKIPHRTEGDRTLLELVPAGASRILDLGCGDGLMRLLLIESPDAEGIAVDFSPTMLEAARASFSGKPKIQVLAHDLDDPLPDWGSFDVIVSGFAIYHCTHERKLSLYREIFARLRPGGIFCNLEHVASPTAELHAAFSPRSEFR